MDKEDLKEKLTVLLEKEFGNWLDANVDLIKSRIPERCKIFPILCGSMVEGFLSKGSDLDFSLIIDDRSGRPIIRGKLTKKFGQFLDELDKKVRAHGLDHVCSMARKLRTTDYLLKFENCSNPQFRVNYFLFGKLIQPKTTNSEIRKRLGSLKELLEFKRSFQREYRRKYDYKLFNVEKSVLTNPERYGPKRIYREIQLIVNNFLMAYGLEEEKLTEKMDEELREKTLEIIKATLMRKARTFIESDVKGTFDKLFELKKRGKEVLFKRRRLRFFRKEGIINDDEWKKLQRLLKYLLEYVYEPLENFYEIQVKLLEILKDDFGVDIKWLGLRKDHAYIAFGQGKIKCLDIIPGTQTDFDVYIVVKREIFGNLINRNYEKLIEVEATEPLFDIALPYKKHVSIGRWRRGRVHFKLFSVKRNEDVNSLKEKINQSGLWTNAN